LTEIILAVDGGNAKTDLALVSAQGEVLSVVRGPGSSPHEHGLDGALDRIEALLAEARGASGVDGLAIADLSLAGVDFPHEVETTRRGIEQRGWARRVEVGNDTHALLRAGTDRGWGVAVVCGAGINCAGVGPDGREARFPALGDITGDWGGGYDLGAAAVFAAARSEDGRGPRTALEQAVPAHFGLPSMLALAEAVHLGELIKRRFTELAPVVLAEAPADPVAAALVARQADEIVAFVRVALQRLGPLPEPVDVVLGGGIARARHPQLLAAVEAGLDALSVPLALRVVDAPPVVGAALLGLDRIGAPAAAKERVRRELAPEMAEASHG
jgi:N-acetylglucosamine kinase-like BadF-type ATPase